MSTMAERIKMFKSNSGGGGSDPGGEDYERPGIDGVLARAEKAERDSKDQLEREKRQKAPQRSCRC